MGPLAFPSVTASAHVGATADEPGYVKLGMTRWRTGRHTAFLNAGTMPLENHDEPEATIAGAELPLNGRPVAVLPLNGIAAGRRGDEPMILPA